MAYFANGSTYTKADYQGIGLQPQAFVAYVPEVLRPGNGNTSAFNDLASCEETLQEEWQVGYSIQECFKDYTDAIVGKGGFFTTDGYSGRPANGIIDYKEYKISGCVDLNTYDR
jgi:hypothetical protein